MQDLLDRTTLLITTYNRSRQLNNSLERLTHLTTPREILIVDDGSADNTHEVVDGFVGRLPIRYIYNHNPEWSICSMARNIGVKNCIGDIIITAEPELLFITDIVKQMLEDREHYPNEVISAGVVYHAQQACTFSPGLITDPIAALHDEIIEEYQTEPRSYRTDGYCRTFNMQATFTALYEKSWIMEVGGWDESFVKYGFDDIDLCTRLRIKGYNQHICPEMKVLHQFHPHLPPHIQGEAVVTNEKIMLAKHLTDDRNNPNLVANKDKEWGMIHER